MLLEGNVRKILSPKFWSHGTYLGMQVPLNGKRGVLGFYPKVILTTWGMSKNPALVIALD